MGDEHKQEHMSPIRKLGGRTNLIGLFLMVFGVVISFFGHDFFPKDYPVDKMTILLQYGVGTVVGGGLIIAGLLKAEDIVRLFKMKAGLSDGKGVK